MCPIQWKTTTVSPAKNKFIETQRIINIRIKETKQYFVCAIHTSMKGECIWIKQLLEIHLTITNFDICFFQFFESFVHCLLLRMDFTLCTLRYYCFLLFVPAQQNKIHWSRYYSPFKKLWNNLSWVVLLRLQWREIYSFIHWEGTWDWIHG